MKIIGHRGAKGLAPENTLLSIGHGLDHGVDGVEFDVRVSKDGTPLLCHDARLSSGYEEIVIKECTYETLKAHKPDLTTLGAALDLIDTKCRVYVEIKAGEPAEPIVRVIRAYIKSGMYILADFIFASRSQETLRAFQQALPGAELMVIEIWSSLRAHRRAKELGVSHVALLESWLYPGLIRAMKRRGYALYAFPPTNHAKKRRFARLGLSGCTENPTKARAWAAAGLAGVITDYPDLFDAAR